MRPCVVAVFVDKGRVLVGERFKEAGQWQFPQGGVEDGETHDQAAIRESIEELGSSAIEIVKKSTATTQYLFPKNLKSRIIKRYKGQIQVWYLMRFKDGAKPSLALAKDQEFSDFRWITPQDAITGVVEWKKQAYKEGLEMLGLSGNSKG